MAEIVARQACNATPPPYADPQENEWHRDCPRLCVYRSDKHIYGQIVDDARGVTLLTVARSRASEGPPGHPG